MQDKTQVVKRSLSRRSILKKAAATVVAVGASPSLFARGIAVAPPPGPEETNLSQVLTLWLAVTNPHPALALPITPATVDKVTGLKIVIPGDHVDVAIKYVNNNQATYNKMKKEFEKFADSFKYTPGQCPVNITTLKKLSDVDPNA